MTTKRVGLLLGPLLFTLIQLFFHPAGLSAGGTALLAATAWMSTWWITEAVPIAVTALLPIILFPLTGGMELEPTTAAYGHRYVFLFLGGFLIAMAIEKWNLHRRIALGIIALIGTNVRMIILGAMTATALLSMWISNTATSVMMLPIATAIVAQLRDDSSTEIDENDQFGKAFMLAVAYSASIGGMASLIGTPVNLVFAGVVRETYGVEISFAQWFMIGFPVSVVLLIMCWWYLTRVAFSFDRKTFTGGREEVRRQQRLLGPISREEKKVLIVFAVTALAWIFRTSVLQNFVPGLDDPIIAMVGGVALFIVPGDRYDRPLLEWSEAVRLPWGIILLLGGGFALAAGFSDSGLAEYIGNTLRVPEGVGLLVVILIITAAVNFLTEITSNVATTSMLMPVFAAAAVPLGIHPYALMVPITLAATCAFMLPVATPPNAVVFGSGYLSIPDMVRAGLWLNLLSIGVIALFCYYLLPLIWGYDPGHVPDWAVPN
ncbi:sodium-dependent dicarboxylate transporter 2/3/5 [Lewinella aquimaris]|uniref:Sodium-dependent dicarboxylate transporter 2/3/5 n=1 Tax=Neolewinella aquimaris TaxID=1835722 RepID=A0A840DX63_9BACT|nr:DASS family sodium-coupled anion symporter [Neolewinella aquimaris]MBB4077591.1 sodium-dependent dicarboxylate transporter 2/3/5 [Neolewinella aquimaris]